MKRRRGTPRIATGKSKPVTVQTAKWDIKLDGSSGLAIDPADNKLKRKSGTTVRYRPKGSGGKYEHFIVMDKKPTQIKHIDFDELIAKYKERDLYRAGK